MSLVPEVTTNTDTVASLETRIKTEVVVSPPVYNRLAVVLARQKEATGMEKKLAKTEAYREMRARVEEGALMFGSTPEIRYLTSELSHALTCLDRGLSDPFDQNIAGVYPAFLTEQDAKTLVLPTLKDYLDLAAALERRENLYGSYDDLRAARIRLEVKAKTMK